MGLDIEEFSDRSIAIGKGINRLCDDLYAATEGDIPAEEVGGLLATGERKMALFEEPLADTTGGMRDGLRKKYADYIEDIGHAQGAGSWQCLMRVRHPLSALPRVRRPADERDVLHARVPWAR